jgi:RHS repeat-associated protein
LVPDRNRAALSGFYDAGSAVAYTDSFQHDMASNRTQLTHTDQTPGGTPGSDGATSVTTSKYDGNDRLLSETTDSVDNSKDTFTTYAYGSGNATSDQTASTTYQGLTAGGTVSASTAYTYDAVGHMTGASVTTGGVTTSVSYAYDASGVRVEQTVGTTRTVYLVDPANPTGYTQVLEEGTDANNNHKLDAAEVQKAYTLGMKVLAQATVTQVLHLLADAHGNTKAVLNLAAGAVTAAILQRFAYTAYGSDLGLTSPLTAVRYAGQMIDPITGLSYNRARWYDPATGRFTQSDVFAASANSPLTINRYLYTSANPINRIDPSGQFSLVEILVSAAGGESLDKLLSSYRAGKASVEAAKWLVRAALVEMEVVVATTPALTTFSRIVAGGYYFYEWLQFEDRMKELKSAAKEVEELPEIATYLGMIPGGAAHLSEYEGDKGYVGKFLPDALKGRRFSVTFIPLTGRRRWDDGIATGMAFGLDIFPLIVSMIDGDVAGAASSLENIGRDASSWLRSRGGLGGQTWHHNEVMGVMELLDSRDHKSFHYGGAFFWSLLRGGEDYK